MRSNFCELEKQIRNGAQPDNPPLLVRYVDIAVNEMDKNTDIRSKKKIILRVLNIFSETICDTYIARHWRLACLDYMYRPQICLQSLCQSDWEKVDFFKHRREFITLSEYFL